MIIIDVFFNQDIFCAVRVANEAINGSGKLLQLGLENHVIFNNLYIVMLQKKYLIMNKLISTI